MDLGEHIWLHLRASLQQQLLDRFVFIDPCIAERPSRSIYIRVGVGATVQQQPSDVQVPHERGVPKWHAPAWSWFFHFFQYNALIHIGT